MKLVPDKHVHLDLIRGATLLSDADKELLTALVEEHGITPEIEEELIAVYRAEMDRLDANFAEFNRDMRRIVEREETLIGRFLARFWN